MIGGGAGGGSGAGMGLSTGEGVNCAKAGDAAGDAISMLVSNTP
jgi:hypothetical protein